MKVVPSLGYGQDGDETLKKGGRFKVLPEPLGRNTFEPVLLSIGQRGV